MIGTIPGPRALLLVGLLALATVAPGCSLLAADEQELPPPDEVEQRVESIHTVKAEIVSSTDLPSGPTESRMEMIVRPQTGEFRAEVLAPDARRGTLIVSNGSTMYMYNRSADRVQVIDVEGFASLRNGSTDAIVSIFEQLNAETDDADTPSSVSSLPVVPGGAGGTGASVTSIPLYGNASFTYEGQGTVDGREAYVVQAVPRGEDPIVQNYTIWLDQEWYYPLRSTGEMQIDGTNRSLSMTYRNITFNPEVPAGTFEFEPPANATVEDASNTSLESYESRSALSAETNRSLPDPDVPPAYEFESGSRIESPDGEEVSLVYVDGDDRLTITVRPPGSTSESTTGESIEVDGTEATIRSIAGNRILTRPCGDRTYTVFGTESRETIVDVAASLPCE